MTTNNLWEDNSRKSNKPMTIEHAGTRYIGIPEEELRAMNKELKELRAKSKSYDTYLDSIGKVWLGTIDTLLDEAQEKWLKENAYKVYTAPHPNTLKGVAMQMPYTFDGLTDGSKTTMPEVDEKPWHINSIMNSPYMTQNEKPWEPKEGERFWWWIKELGAAHSEPYYTLMAWKKFNLNIPIFPTREDAEAHGASLKNPDPDSLAGDGAAFYQPDKMPTESLVERFMPICEALVAEDFELVEELIRQFKTRRHPATLSINELIDELKLGRKFRSEDGVYAWTDPEKQGVVFGIPSILEVTRFVSWSDLPKFLEGKKWERV